MTLLTREFVTEKLTAITVRTLQHNVKLVINFQYKQVRITAVTDADMIKRLFPEFEIKPGERGKNYAELILAYE